MTEIRVYIVDTKKYREDEMVGAWFTPPIDEETIKEKLQLSNNEYTIIGYHAPFEIEEFNSLETINHLGKLMDEIREEPYFPVLNKMIENWFTSLEDLVKHKELIIWHSGCSSMEEVARKHIQEMGMLEGIPEEVSRYFDYRKYGEELQNLRQYLITSRGIFEYTE